MLRGSSLGRIFACPASESLPHSKDESSEDARRGTAIHRYLELVDPVDPNAALAEVHEAYHEECLQLDLDRLPLGPEFEREVSMAFNAVTGECTVLPSRQGEDRGSDYADLPIDCIPCTTDVLGVEEDHVYVGDYKTGRGARPAAGESPQLLIAALCAARIHGKERAVVEYIDLSNPTRPYFDRAEVGFFELEEFAWSLTGLYRLVESGEGLTFNEGDHCKYCPAFEACPKKRKLMASIESNDLDREVEMAWAGSLTRESAPHAYRQWRMVEQMQLRMKKIIMGYASKHDIALPDGRRFGQRTKLGNEQIDGQAAYEVLAREYGPETALSTVKLQCTKAAIKRTLGEIRPKGGIAAAERELLKAIKEEGGVTRKEKTSIEEYKSHD